mmetsp:Transcript_65194/g.165244  ORF Transcript_65194/g.165244 Transcript_65194/m.165244 type:complete len:220 (-) Transcript_65194:292-951(-)
MMRAMRRASAASASSAGRRLNCHAAWWPGPLVLRGEASETTAAAATNAPAATDRGAATAAAVATGAASGNAASCASSDQLLAAAARSLDRGGGFLKAPEPLPPPFLMAAGACSASLKSFLATASSPSGCSLLHVAHAVVGREATSEYGSGEAAGEGDNTAVLLSVWHTASNERCNAWLERSSQTALGDASHPKEPLSSTWPSSSSSRPLSRGAADGAAT